MIIRNPAGKVDFMRSEMSADEAFGCPSETKVKQKDKVDPRKDLANSVFIACNAESHTDCALVTHIHRSTPHPLCLHVADPASNATVARVNQQGNTNVSHFGYQRV